MNSLFPPELRTASIVKRWSIVRTFDKDSVAEHSFYVAYYAVKIAQLIEWRGPMGDLMFCALMHDIEETMTGDIISPVKKAIVDPSLLASFIEQEGRDRLPLISTQVEFIQEEKTWGKQIKAIVKVADKVDACLFLIGEMRMGNAVLGALYNDALHHLHEAWNHLGPTCKLTDMVLDEMWNDDLYPALQAHFSYGSRGIT